MTTNNNVLTAAICAMYIGCRITDEYHAILNLVGVSFYEDMIQVEFRGNETDWWNISKDCKLILKPLADISDADAIEVAKMHGGTKVHIEGNFMQIINDDQMVEAYYILGGNMPLKLINFLRSKSYDCDSLLQSGIAITAKDK